MTLETGVQSKVKSYQRLKKWYYAVQIKGEVEQSVERSSDLIYTPP